jgi:hypothetical protein
MRGKNLGRTFKVTLSCVVLVPSHTELPVELETRVKFAIYATIAETAMAPTAAEVSAALGTPIAQVEGAFRELFQKRLLVLEPGSSRIRMAPPFSALNTSFRVVAKGKSFFANCVWDALGVAAALHSDASIEACCGDCGASMSVQVRGGKPIAQDCVIHFAVQAAHWWDDIIYT